MSASHSETAQSRQARGARLRASAVALVAGTAILAAKFMAWRATASQVVFSDAMESIVNVAAAGFLIFAVRFAAMPADDDHPYGHGKIEFVTSGFEGGLIAFAALAIVYESIIALVDGSVPVKLDLGMLIVGGAGVANLALGAYLVRTGRTHNSRALIADGEHVISDFWTSAGAVFGLLLVKLTDQVWLDSAVAIVVALVLLRTGVRLVRESARGLLDEQDPELIAELAGALETARIEGVIEVHDLRVIDVGNRIHADLHVVVPEFWTVDQAHSAMDRYEHRVIAEQVRPGELQFHMDPCERLYCRNCDLTDCPVRGDAFEVRRPISADSVVDGPRPASGQTHEDPVPLPSARKDG